jgi:biopolymer transport protein ExbB/TolQ
MFADILRAVATALATPVNIVLVALIAATIFVLGTLIVESLTEHRRVSVKLPELADKLRGVTGSVDGLESVIRDSGLLRRQIAVLTELTAHPELTPSSREALAVRLVSLERAHYEGIVRVTDIIAKIGPMFGLLGTLCPLGPGIIALGRGDTYTLSNSLLVAFDTTIAGLITAAFAFVISAIRKKWYLSYMESLEMTAECVLEAIDQRSPTDDALGE